MSTIQIDTLFREGVEPSNSTDVNPSDIIKAAEIIFGRDRMTGNEFLVFGREVLERIVRTGDSEDCRTIYIECDQKTDDLEWMCALVETHKGRHDYPV